MRNSEFNYMEISRLLEERRLFHRERVWKISPSKKDWRCILDMAL